MVHITLVEIGISSLKCIEKTEVQIFKSLLEKPCSNSKTQHVDSWWRIRTVWMRVQVSHLPSRPFKQLGQISPPWPSQGPACGAGGGAGASLGGHVCKNPLLQQTLPFNTTTTKCHLNRKPISTKRTRVHNPTPEPQCRAELPYNATAIA